MSRSNRQQWDRDWEGLGKRQKRAQSEGWSGRADALGRKRRNSDAEITHPIQRILDIREPWADRRSPAGFTTSSGSISNIHTNIYRALNNVVGSQEFRLLIVNRGAGLERIRCRLLYSNLQNPSVYTALSYTWLDSRYHTYDVPQQEAGRRDYIFVNGHQVYVTTNLFSALWHLRSEREQRTFWIDAICIDQSNIEEMNHQVGLMQEIYRKAENVIAWLGSGYDRGSDVMRVIRNIILEQDHGQRRQMLLRALNSPKVKFTEAYMRIFQRTYWYRTWIMQEIFSAADVSVHCGHAAASWNTLVEFQSWLTAECFGTREADNTIRPGIIGNILWRQRGAASFEQMRTCLSSANRFIDLSRLRHAGYRTDVHDSDRTLECLLLEHWDTVAANPRDKIFAIFRLASDGDDYEIEVDYETTVHELFTNVVKKTIELTGKLSIILPRRPSNPEHNLPSWCLDFSVSEPASELGNWQDVYPFQVSPGSVEYCAAGLGSMAQVRFGATGHSLVAKGFLIDVVRRTSRHAQPPEVSEPKWRSRRSFFTSLMDFIWPTERQRTRVRPAKKLELWYSVLRETLHYNYKRGIDNRTLRRGRSGFRKFCRKQHMNFFWILHRATNILSHELPRRNRPLTTNQYLDRWIQHQDLPSKHTDRVADELRDVCRDMGKIQINENYSNFFVTREGYLGLGPVEMAKGDRVVVLFGCDVPVVLRWEGRAYRLVGQCYVVGAMHGELEQRQRAVLGDEADDYPGFEIC